MAGNAIVCLNDGQRLVRFGSLSYAGITPRRQFLANLRGPKSECNSGMARQCRPMGHSGPRRRQAGVKSTQNRDKILTKIDPCLDTPFLSQFCHKMAPTRDRLGSNLRQKRIQKDGRTKTDPVAGHPWKPQGKPELPWRYLT